MIGGLWIHRGFILRNALNDLRQRYAGSAFGVIWNILNPLAQILVYTFVFSKVMAAKLPNVNSTFAFAIYLCSGLLPWISFSETILRGTGSLLENSTYLKKLPIPEQIFVAQITVSSTLVLFISMILLSVINFFLGGAFTISWAALPLVLILFQGLAFGVALALSCLNVLFRDIGQLVGIFLQVWMWTTPIVYVKDILPAFYQRILLYNPVFTYIESLHKIVVFGQWPEPQYWISMILFCLFSVIIGMLLLSKLQTEIRDVL